MKSFGVTSFGPWCETRSFALISDVADGIFLLTIKRGWRRQLFLCRKWQSDEPGVIWKVQLPLGRYLVWRRLFSDIVPTASAPEELEDYLTTARHIDEKTGKVTWVKFVTNVVPRPAPGTTFRLVYQGPGEEPIDDDFMIWSHEAPVPQGFLDDMKSQPSEG